MTIVPAIEEPKVGESFEPGSSLPTWAIEGNPTSKQTMKLL
jgi:hypothetical protein